MPAALIAIIAIIAWAAVQITRGKGKGVDRTALDDLAARLDVSEAERARLTERVQNLEAIVTTETFDLARKDLPAAEARLALPDEPEALPEAEATRLARRLRS